MSIEYKELRNHMINDTIEDFVEFLNGNVNVESYIPIGRKTAIMDIFSRNFSIVIENILNDKFATLSELYMEYEMRKIFDILLKYIDVEFDMTYQNNMEYDLIMQSGLYDYIINVSYADYHKFCEYLDYVVGIRDISILDLFNKKLNTPTVDDVEKMVSKIENIDKNKIDKLMKIVEMNDPLTTAVRDIIKSSAGNNINNNDNNVINFPDDK